MLHIEESDVPPADLIPAADLFVRHATFVATFLRRLGSAPQDVDDLVQETFLVVHRHGGFQPGAAKPTTWLAAIALRLFQNHRRSVRRKLSRDVSIEPAEPVDHLALLEARSSLERVERALLELDTEHRAVFVLFELQDQSCDDIAQALAVPIGTVYSRLHHARRKFINAYHGLASGPSADARTAGVRS